MGAMMTRKILSLMETRRVRHLKKAMRPNWVRSLIIASYTIYVFFRTSPRIDYVEGRRAHIFECAAGRCRGKNGRDVRRYLDKGDAKSTSGLRRHATKCWGVKTNLRDGTITAEFERIGKGKVTFK